jgi:hypothetical protein
MMPFLFETKATKVLVLKVLKINEKKYCLNSEGSITKNYPLVVTSRWSDY